MTSPAKSGGGKEKRVEDARVWQDVLRKEAIVRREWDRTHGRYFQRESALMTQRTQALSSIPTAAPNRPGLRQSQSFGKIVYTQDTKEIPSHHEVSRNSQYDRPWASNAALLKDSSLLNPTPTDTKVSVLKMQASHGVTGAMQLGWVDPLAPPTRNSQTMIARATFAAAQSKIHEQIAAGTPGRSTSWKDAPLPPTGSGALTLMQALDNFSKTTKATIVDIRNTSKYPLAKVSYLEGPCLYRSSKSEFNVLMQ